MESKYIIETKPFEFTKQHLDAQDEFIKKCNNVFNEELKQQGYCYVHGRTGIPMTLYKELFGESCD